MVDQDLTGRVVLVAGASSGMGRAVALAGARAGAHVVLAARSTDALRELHEEVVGQGGTALAITMDATDRAAVECAISAAWHEYGQLDVVVDSVGTNIRDRSIDQLTIGTWSEMVDVNLTAAFNLTHCAVPLMRDHGGGLLIYISSSAARKPDRSGIAYQATKAGVAGLAHGVMEEEREHGIRTTVVFPGLTDTPMVLKRPTPPPPDVLARALQPEDVAAACLFVMRLPDRAHVQELVLYPSRA